MKILTVIGSPHKGECYQAYQLLKEEMLRCGPAEFDELWLKDLNLRECMGCHACFKLGEDRCPCKDDFSAILERFQAADGVILLSPVYTLQVSTSLKKLFDRMAFLWHRPRFFGKFVMGLSSGGGQFSETLGYMKQNAEAWGCTWVTGVGVAHLDALVPSMRAKTLKSLAAGAQKFYRVVEAQRLPMPSLNDLIRFRVWQINSRYSFQGQSPDFAYWTKMGWFDSDYYTGQRIPLPQKGISLLMKKVIHAFLRTVYVGY